MKSKIMLSGIAALLVSVSGANALEMHPFVGAGLGLQGLRNSSDVRKIERNNDIDFPSSLFTIGIEGGVRFGEYKQIYNGGVSVNLDMSTASDIKKKFNDDKIAELDSTVFSATYDNYIRISGDKTSRIDLVLGLGLGSMSYTVDDSVVAGLKNQTEHSAIGVLKVGLDFELSKNFTLSAMSRLFVPTKSDYKLDASYIFGGMGKYVF